MSKHIRIITPLVTPQFRGSGDLQALEREGMRITNSQIEIGPASIESEFDEALCVPGTIQKALQAQRDGVDAVIIDCMGDPGVNACRELLDILVLGPSQTSMHAAAMLSQRFSVVTVLDSVVPMLENLAKIYGLSDKLTSVRSVNIPVLEIDGDPHRLLQSLTEESARAVSDDGAHSIVLGCTGFLGCAEAVAAGLKSRGLAVSVIDPIPITVRLAFALLESGLTQSRRTFAPPRDKAIHGFEFLDLRRE